MNRQNAFIFGEKWFTFSNYTIREFDGIKCILPNSGVTKEDIVYYAPMENKGEINRPKEMEELIHNSPHVHLANVDLNDEDKILQFVNTWGLLGLWRVHEYSEAVNLPGKILSVGLERESYSSWFEYQPRKSSKLRWMEPLSLFKQAAVDYQTLLKELTNARTATKDPDTIVSTELKLNSMITGIKVKSRWDKDSMNWTMDLGFKSLLDVIYLRTLFDFQNSSFIHCLREGCSNVFVNTKSSNQFCSDLCKNKHYVEQKRRRDKVKEIKLHFPDVEEKCLLHEIDNLYKSGFRRKKQIIERLTKIFNDQSKG